MRLQLYTINILLKYNQNNFTLCVQQVVDLAILEHSGYIYIQNK